MAPGPPETEIFSWPCVPALLPRPLPLPPARSLSGLTSHLRPFDTQHGGLYLISTGLCPTRRSDVQTGRPSGSPRTLGACTWSDREQLLNQEHARAGGSQRKKERAQAKACGDSAGIQGRASRGKTSSSLPGPIRSGAVVRSSLHLPRESHGHAGVCPSEGTVSPTRAPWSRSLLRPPSINTLTGTELAPCKYFWKGGDGSVRDM